MAQYDYPDDGQLHTRYSELAACQTLASAYAIAEQKLGIRQRHETPAMAFGTARHEMFQEEGESTGLTPECFKEALGVQWPIAETEKHRATEIYKGIVFHFTIDVVTQDPDVIDYKTGTGANGANYTNFYSSSFQVPTYAYLLRPHGYNIKRGHYLIEMWNRERTELEGYKLITKEIGLRELANAKNMLKVGTQNLISAMDAVSKAHNL